MYPNGHTYETMLAGILHHPQQTAFIEFRQDVPLDNDRISVDLVSSERIIVFSIISELIVILVMVILWHPYSE